MVYPLKVFIQNRVGKVPPWVGFVLVSFNSGGGLTLEGSMDTCHPLRHPFSGHFFFTELRRPTISSPLTAPETPSFMFWKKIAFSNPTFADEFQLLRHIFSENLFPRPQFQVKKSVLESLLLKNLGGMLPKNFRVPGLSTPPHFLWSALYIDYSLLIRWL